MAMWTQNPVFDRIDENSFGQSLSPAFRLSAYFPYRAAHPYVLTQEWEKLLACFAPLLRRHCDRIRMWDRPGAKARRKKAIEPGDWSPFQHIKNVHSDVDQGIFTGFYFVDRTDDAEMGGRGPCAFRSFVGSAIRLDVCISPDDWLAGELDPEAVVAALQQLPYISFLAGYGLCLSDRFVSGDAGAFAGQLMPIAERYPALDLMHFERRSWFSGTEQDFADIGIAGINWLTGIGEPFVSRAGGAQALASGLPTGIHSKVGPHGVVFQLGARPITGEARQDDQSLPLYHALGARLKGAHWPHRGSSAVRSRSSVGTVVPRISTCRSRWMAWPRKAMLRIWPTWPPPSPTTRSAARCGCLLP